VRLEALLSKLWDPLEAKRYLNIKKVDRALTKIHPGNYIADIGAGLCLDILTYMTADRSIKGVAVDISKKDLVIGRDWAKILGVHNRLDLCIASALNLPFRDERIDLSVSYSAIEHLPKREFAQSWINEMARITRKGGTVVVTTSNKLWPTYIFIRITEFLKHRRSNEFFFHPYEVKAMIERAGFCPVAFCGRGLYYYELFPSILPGSKYINSAVSKIINSLQNFSCFQVICGRIGFRAIKKEK